MLKKNELGLYVLYAGWMGNFNDPADPGGLGLAVGLENVSGDFREIVVAPELEVRISEETINRAVAAGIDWETTIREQAPQAMQYFLDQEALGGFAAGDEDEYGFADGTPAEIATEFVNSFFSETYGLPISLVAAKLGTKLASMLTDIRDGLIEIHGGDEDDADDGDFEGGGDRVYHGLEDNETSPYEDIDFRDIDF